MKLENNLYAYVWSGQDNNCNTYVLANVLDQDGHVVVDPGHVKTPSTSEPGLERLYGEMREDGLDPDAIGLVLLTHCHPDHSEAARVIREDKQALVAIHKSEFAIYARLGGKADIFLEPGDLDLGKRKPTRLKIFHSPGHSPGHLTIYWPKEKVLFAGDLIFHRSTGRTDLPGGNPKELKRSIEQLAKLDLEYVLCGHPYGHPGVLAGAEEVRANFEFLKENVLF
ncbi:MAG: MBL fold metallo-hydrolase [Proteobacteria bacterium]|nr:MBL fold metallo-hydrolase [Pseudomonadota bacterium]